MKIQLNPSIRLSILILTLTIFSCQKDKLVGDIMVGEIIYDKTFIENLYTNSSDTIIIEDQKLILQTEIYRDFFPGVLSYDEEPRLSAQIYIVNIDSTLITQNFKVTKLYIINNDQAWTSEPESRTDLYLPENKAYLVSINGPEWETGIYVDVVISITDLTNNKEKILIARNQIIKRSGK